MPFVDPLDQEIKRAKLRKLSPGIADQIAEGLRSGFEAGFAAADEEIKLKAKEKKEAKKERRKRVADVLSKEAALAGKGKSGLKFTPEGREALITGELPFAPAGGIATLADRPMADPAPEDLSVEEPLQQAPEFDPSIIQQQKPFQLVQAAPEEEGLGPRALGAFKGEAERMAKERQSGLQIIASYPVGAEITDPALIQLIDPFNTSGSMTITPEIRAQAGQQARTFVGTRKIPFTTKELREREIEKSVARGQVKDILKDRDEVEKLDISLDIANKIEQDARKLAPKLNRARGLLEAGKTRFLGQGDPEITEFRTMTGLNLAQIIHTFSGAAASDLERAFYISLMPGEREDISQILAKNRAFKTFIQMKRKGLLSADITRSEFGQILKGVADLDIGVDPQRVEGIRQTIMQLKQQGIQKPTDEQIMDAVGAQEQQRQAPKSKVIVDPDNPNQTIRVIQRPDGTWVEE